MLTLDSLNADKPFFVFLANGFAEKSLPVWEKEYPEDSRPRKAIEAAKEWLKNPSDIAAGAAYAAYAAANAAAYAAAYAAAANANAAANAAAYAAANAAAKTTAYTAAYTAAANAAANAAAALGADKETLIHEVILENLDWILQYKIENGQSFAQPEFILSCLTEEQKQSFLFNLDRVA